MNWLQRFMAGRYGLDTLSKAMLLLSLLSLLIGRLFHFSPFLLIAAAALLVSYFRILSKDLQKRYQENVKFIQKWNRVRLWAGRKVSRIQDSRYHCYFKCKGCGQTLRVPRGKGNIRITCPKCQQEIVKKT